MRTLTLVLSLGAAACTRAAKPEAWVPDDQLTVRETADGVRYVRTPDARFQDLPDWPYAPRYVEIDGLRQAYVDEGPRDGEVVLLLHGQPSWSYLYRHMIPGLVDAGYRVIAMDHLGMGRSDKPVDLDRYTFLDHVHRLEAFIEALELRGITCFVQDWGSVIGLQVVGLHPARFDRVVLGNGALPEFDAEADLYPPPADRAEAVARFYKRIRRIPARQPRFYREDGSRRFGGGGDPAAYFATWIAFSRDSLDFRASLIVEAMTWDRLEPAEKAAYDAPFPARIAMGGPRSFPGLARSLGGVTAPAWEGLSAFDKPFLTIWGGNDPGQLGQPLTQQQMIEAVPGAAGQPHARLPRASHFLQDDQGEEIARRMVAFMRANPAR